MFYIADKMSNKILSFEEFSISESLRPLRIDYGTDLKNEEWNSVEDIKWTFIKYDRYFYCIIIDHGQIGFATSQFFDQKKMGVWENIPKYFDFDERKTSSAAKVFSHVFYVIIAGIKKYNIPLFFFSAQHPALGNVYKRMVEKNKYFLDAVDKAGFQSEGEIEGKFIFKKKGTNE